jgi:putative spermidine/putrescine transport system permease protein
MKGKSIFWIPTAILFALFFIIPLVSLLIASFTGDQGFTIGNYVKIFTEKYYYSSMLNSLLLSVTVTITSTILAGLFGYFLAYNNFKGKALYLTLLTFPISLPGVVVGFMIIILFGKTGGWKNSHCQRGRHYESR